MKCGGQVNNGLRSPRRQSNMSEYIAELEGRLEERANANDHRRRSGVRLSGARDEQSRHPGGVPRPPGCLDNWDPRVVDGFAASRRVITFDNRGVGASSGSPATSIEQMAKDAITFIKAMRFERVDFFGLSRRHRWWIFVWL